jgi:hypothetical protein
MAEILSLNGQLESQRRPVPGRARGEEPDIAHPWFAVEHKYGLRVLSSVQRLAWEQADAAARDLDLVPLVTMESRQGRGKPLERFVMMRAADFAEMLDVYLAHRAAAGSTAPSAPFWRA